MIRSESSNRPRARVERGGHPRAEPGDFGSSKLVSSTAAGLVTISVLAVLLRIFLLGRQSLWWDEAASAHLAGLNWPHLWDALWTSGEGNMALYYAILHVWTALGGSEFALRLPSVFFATATIAVFYVFGARLSGTRTGLLAALLLAVNVYHIRYSQEARSYTLLVLLVTLSSMFFVSGIQRPTQRAWTAYVITTTLAVYAHFFGVLVLAAHWISTQFIRRRDVPWGAFVKSTCVIGALLVPVGIFLFTKDQGQVDWVSRVGPEAIGRALTSLAGAGPTSDKPAAATLYTLANVGRRLLLLLYAGLITLALTKGVWRETGRARYERWMYAFLATWLLAPPILAYIVSMRKPIFVIRYLIVSLPPLVFLIADGLSRIQRRALSVGVLGALVGLAGLQICSYYSYTKKDDWRSATAYILARTQPGDGLMFYPNMAGADPTRASRAAFEFYRNQYTGSSTTPQIHSWNDRQRDRHRRLWLVVAKDDDQRVLLDTSLAAGRYFAEERDFSGSLHVLLYTRTGRP